jgi:Mrp family chromosome partitioning ATPase
VVTEALKNKPSSLRDYAAVFRRRLWLVLLVAVLVPAAAVTVSLQRQPLYEASAEVLLNRTNVAAQVTDRPDPLADQDPERLAQTQADIARSPALVGRVIAAAGVSGLDRRRFLEDSAVVPKPDADILVFEVAHRRPAVASRLATTYAQEYREYRRLLDTAAIEQAKRNIRRAISRQREADDLASSALLADLEARLTDLESYAALQTFNTHLLRAARETEQVQPKTVRNAIIAVLFGLALGVGLVFLVEALDTRVRSEEEIEQTLAMRYLGRAPAPSRALRTRDKLVTIAGPAGEQTDAFRTIANNIRFVNRETRARVIMVTSAVEREGKSTTIANLAVSLAQDGLRVVLVDLNLRDPCLHRLFDLPRSPGVGDVLMGTTTARQASTSLAVSGPQTMALRSTGDGDGIELSNGTLRLLTAGDAPTAVGGQLGSDALGRLVGDLYVEADLILIDAPSLLGSGDATSVAGLVDALFVVARRGVVTRPGLHELRRVLDMCPAAKLGFVVAGAADGSVQGYGDSRVSSKPSKHDTEAVVS